MNTFDKEVIGLQQGKESSLCYFMDQYSHALHFYAFKIIKDRDIAREIVSEAFFKLWEKKENFHAEESIKSFLYLVTRNECLDHLKLKRNQLQHDEAWLVDLESGEESILSKIIYTELIEKRLRNYRNSKEKSFSYRYWKVRKRQRSVKN